MKFVPAGLPGVVLVEPHVHADSRGSFREEYRRDRFAAAGITDDFVQDNVSRSRRGVVRGLHFQRAPRSQAKLVRVLSGAVHDVVVDLRRGSATLGRHLAVRLQADDGRWLYVPAGFAHGFLSLEDDTDVLYKVSDLYSPEHEGGVRWDDPALGISWPGDPAAFLLSDKDRALPTLAELTAAGRLLP